MNQLEKMFVIFAIKVGEEWLTHDQIKEYYDNNNNIYNITQFQMWEMDIDFNNPHLSSNKLGEITQGVEKCCPVGKHFGVEGTGEGVVWTMFHNNNRLVFKVKGEEHSMTKVKTLAPVDIEKVNSINEFVDYAVTENRFKQAIHEVFECRNEQPTIKKLGELIKWVQHDVEKEERRTLEKSNLTFKDVSSKIGPTVKKIFVTMDNKKFLE